MKEHFKKIIFLIDDSQKSKIPLLIFLFLVLSISEIAGLSLILPYISLIVGDSNSTLKEWSLFLNIDNKEQLIVSLSIALLTVFLIKTILVIKVNRAIINFGLKQRVNLGLFLMKSYQSLPYSEYLKRNSSEFIHNIQALTAAFSSAIMLILRTISSLIVSIFIISLLAWQNFTAFSILILITFIALFLYDFFLKDRLIDYGKRSNTSSDNILKTLNESLGGLKEVRVLSKETFFFSKFEKNIVNHAKYSSKQQIIQLIPRFLLELIMILFVVILVLITLFSEVGLGAIAPTLGVFGIASLRLMPAVNTISQALLQLRSNHDSINRLYKDVQTLKNKETKQKTCEGCSPVFESISLINVCFSYEGSSKKLLNNINIKINSGESVGLIGKSGSGKTTLVDVILGLLPPDKGEVLINDRITLSSYLSNWRKIVSYIPQQVLMLDDSLESNISLDLSKNVNDKKMENSIKMSKLYQFISRLPKGIQTNIGENGICLSGGQRQRVAISRSLYHDRGIIVMDESTSALDMETEIEVINEIRRLKKDKTLIVIAHRLETLKYCDIIYELKDGDVANSGSYNKMIKNKL